MVRDMGLKLVDPLECKPPPVILSYGQDGPPDMLCQMPRKLHEVIYDSAYPAEVGFARRALGGAYLVRGMSTRHNRLLFTGWGIIH